MKIELSKGLDELIEHYTDFFWGIGFFGWQISSIYALYICYLHSILSCIIFLFIFILSGWMNHIILKNYINDLRPADSTPFLSSEHFRKRTNGMPSGHAQLTAYALSLAYLLSNKYLYESIAIFAITIYQRYIFKNHTIPQLFVGSVIGFIIGYLTYLLILFIEKNSKNKQKVSSSKSAPIHNTISPFHTTYGSTSTSNPTTTTTTSPNKSNKLVGSLF